MFLMLIAACELELSTQVEAKSTEHFEITALAKNLTNKPQVVDLIGICRKTPVDFNGLPGDYEYYNNCDVKCQNKKLPPYDVTIAPGESRIISVAQVDANGGYCNKPLPTGGWDIGFAKPSRVKQETCFGSKARLSYTAADWVLISSSGEMSRDASDTTYTWKAYGAETRLTIESSGRHREQNEKKTMKTPDGMQALFDAIDKVPAPKTLPRMHETRYHRICLRRGANERCGVTLHGGKDDANMEALSKLVVKLSGFGE